MSCLNPMLMAVVSTKGFTFQTFHRLEKCGWKFNRDTQKAYRLVAKESRNQPLEEIESYMDLSTIEVPCGGCIQCRLDSAQDWAIRCTHEAKLYKENYFVTLSYNVEHLIPGKFGMPTLSKRDFQLFMKRLRSKLKRKFKHVGVRFFGCGEYGDLNLRPHLHIILFNCPLNDLTERFPDGEGHIIKKKNKLGMPLYYSELIASCWTDDDGNSKGFIAIDDANFNTESYVSRYILKKQKGDNSKVYSDKFGVIPPFVLMSNRPGIGFNYYLEKKDSYIDNPSVIVGRPNKVPLVATIPRYYKKKLLDGNPKLSAKFEANAKYKKLCKHSINFDNQTTMNEQRSISEDRSNKIARLFIRDID